LIDAFREEFREDLPFIVSQPIFGSPSVWPHFPGMGIVREQTAAVAAQVPKVYLFEVDDLATTDGTHFTAPAQIQHGERFADTYIAAVAPGLPGDIDEDGDVDLTDMSLFVAHSGTSAGSIWTTGDFNGDAKTSLRDLALLQANFGTRAAILAPGESPSAAAVPEPSSIVLVIIGMFVIGALGRLHRSVPT
jgi:hypothetical protein